MDGFLDYLLAFVRIVAYIYVAFVGYDSFKSNGHDKKLSALLVSNVLMASALMASLLFKVFNPESDITGEVISVALTPVAVFWAMTHFYVYFKNNKK